MKQILKYSAAFLVTINICCTTTPKKPKPVINNALIIGNPLSYGVDNTLIFPVGANYKPVVHEAANENELRLISSKSTLSFAENTSASFYDRMAYKEYLNTDEDKFDIRNILFYNLGSGETYSLVTDTVHILSFAMHKEFEKGLIFYRIVKKDNNNDSIFNSQDPVMLFISDMHGKSLTQITPQNEKFSDYTYYKTTKTILIKTIIDSDNDKKFTHYDETNFREMKITEPSMGREIFAKSLKDSLRMQLKVN